VGLARSLHRAVPRRDTVVSFFERIDVERMKRSCCHARRGAASTLPSVRRPILVCETTH
jgi:hypothetical protein